MAVQSLSSASALTPGHDLWVVPDLAHSRWTLKLDWQLNFQILNAGRHENPPTPEPLAGLLSDIDWQPEEIRLPRNAPLMVSPENHLPARWLVVVPIEGDPTWAERIANLWTSLGRPSVRVFLPRGLPSDRFARDWEKYAQGDELALVPDQEG